jgi:uncharacterized protein (TIGR02391 family)
MAAVSRSDNTRPLALADIPSAVRKLTRRLNELRELELPGKNADPSTIAKLLAIQTNRVNATIDEVFGDDTAEAKEFRVDPILIFADFFSTSWDELVQRFNRGRDTAIASISAAIDGLQEKLADEDENADGRLLRAYERLALHQEIARAASDLYRDRHYANAVEASVKALNGLVRLRSGLELDGTSLMEKAFSPANPILKFNDLSDQSDRDEQKGFMMMFSGAVSGLRNPRAHGFIHDDAERALEFIAFVSLLAKLLDEAKQS